MTDTTFSYLKFKTMINLRRAIYIGLLKISLLRKGNPQVVVLCYHAVGNDDWRFSINLTTLIKQVSYLIKRYKPMSLEGLELVISGKKKVIRPSFILTFDDGYMDVLATQSYFKKMGIKPALFVLSDRAGANRRELHTDRAFLNKREILSLAHSGWLIGCHSASHSNLTKLSSDELKKEVVDSKKSLERELGIKVNYFSYPKGNYSPRVLAMTKKAGYKLALSMDDGFISEETDPFIVPRVGVDRTHSFDEFKSLFLPLSIMFRRFVKENVGVLS